MRQIGRCRRFLGVSCRLRRIGFHFDERIVVHTGGSFEFGVTIQRVIIVIIIVISNVIVVIIITATVQRITITARWYTFTQILNDILRIWIGIS